MDIATIAKGLGPIVKRNSSTILTGLGVAGSIGSAVLAVKATPGAVRKLDEAYLIKNTAANHEELEGLPVTALTPGEVIKVVWKDYIPAVGLQIITISCVIGAQGINLRRQAALISIATVSETAFREYREGVKAEDPKVDHKVRSDINQRRIDENPVGEREVIIVAGAGDQLFYDSHTDRYFMSTMQRVQKAVNDINFRAFNQNYASLNEFYQMIGLKPVAQGDETGWTAEHTLEINYDAKITEDDRPAIVLDFYKTPLKNMWKGFA